MKTDFKPGDILAFSGTSCLSRGIQLCTLGPISHVGILANDRDGTLRLYEAALVDGVRRQRWQSAVKWTVHHGGRVWHYPLVRPLVPEDQLLSNMAALVVRGQHSWDLTGYVESQLSKPYDKVGAFRARSLGFGWLCHLLPNREGLGNLFCSEFVAASLRFVGRFSTSNASKWNPTHLCRTLRRRGVVGKPVLIRRPVR